MMLKRATLGLKVIDPGADAPKAKPTPVKPVEAAKATPKVVEPPPAPPATPKAAPPAAEVPEPPPANSGSLLGLESSSFSSDLGGSLDGAIEIEPTSLLDPPTTGPLGGRASGTLDFVLPDGAEVAPAEEVPLLEDSFITPDAAETLSPEAAASAEFPLLDAPLDDVGVKQQPLPSIAQPSTLIAEKSVEMLQAVVEGDPEDWASRRELAEAMLEAGNREGGVRELEAAMSGYERNGDLATAMSVADEIVRVDPGSVKHHQKRVEYAYRTNDRPQLVEAYLALADALSRGGQVDKSRTI